MDEASIRSHLNDRSLSGDPVQSTTEPHHIRLTVRLSHCRLSDRNRIDSSSSTHQKLARLVLASRGKACLVAFELNNLCLASSASVSLDIQCAWA